MDIKRISANSHVEAAIDALNADGCVVIEDLISADMARSIAGGIQPYLDRTPNASGPFVGFKTKRTGGAFKKVPQTIDLARHSLVLKIMDAVLGPHCSRYQINLTQFICLQPGQRAQIFHRDEDMFGSHPKSFEHLVNVVWAIDDFTARNGATLVAPSSHKWPADRYPTDEEICVAEMKAGSALVFLGSFKHAAGANHSNSSRLGFVISYCLGWLRQYENQYLAMPPSIARGLPREFLQLLGYSIHEPNLGVYEGQDPIVTLDEECPDVLQAKDYFSQELMDQVEAYYAEKEDRNVAAPSDFGAGGR